MNRAEVGEISLQEKPITKLGTDHGTIGLMFSAISFVRGLISLAGVILLVYAFWQKFRTRLIMAEANLGSRTIIK